MGFGDSAKEFSVVKEDSLALLDLLGEEDAAPFHDTNCTISASAVSPNIMPLSSLSNNKLELLL